jgi:hypothetical protein
MAKLLIKNKFRGIPLRNIHRPKDLSKYAERESPISFSLYPGKLFVDTIFL